VETREHKRFQEFCHACRRDRYIGLCYGPPGIGKTLSALRCTSWNTVAAYDAANNSKVPLKAVQGNDAAFYTPSIVSTPKQIAAAIAGCRQKLRAIAGERLRIAHDARLGELQKALKKLRGAAGTTDNLLTFNDLSQTIHDLHVTYARRRNQVADPTALIVIDEADRLKMSGLEQVRDIFDAGGMGLVLIGMPGIEKRLARYPQLYSRVGFVHEFRPLATAEVRRLLSDRWAPEGVTLPRGALRDEAAIAAIVRVAGGNFRLLQRLLTQIARVLQINGLRRVTADVVETARESLVIGTD
jgi:DNA transposition AAA+ family ATPase